MKNYTEYLFDKESIRRRVAEAKKNLKENRGISDALGFWVNDVFMFRLKQDKKRYRDYGPYWWAVKEVLKKAGFELGDTTEENIRRIYCGDTDEETLIMADEFRTDYLKRNIRYTNRFLLDAEEPGFWELFDQDME
ncbi:MAG: hypothetical protein NC211_03560 [Alistipes senegalensis]|nr:hypothetical protein [Oxalobacter formigenes]MCM1280895.1 hypothetical protein [Alistipes senegalensis]